jgi:hypothetical protein
MRGLGESEVRVNAFARGAPPNHLLQRTGHANDGSPSFSSSSRVSRLLSVAFGGGDTIWQSVLPYRLTSKNLLRCSAVYKSRVTAVQP